MDGKVISVQNSDARTLLTQYSKSGIDRRNAYGLFLWQYDSGQILPMICGHGGSMWLCWTCAYKAMEEQNRETGIERYWREQASVGEKKI